jgi:hypothetical protein
MKTRSLYILVIVPVLFAVCSAFAFHSGDSTKAGPSGTGLTVVDAKLGKDVKDRQLVDETSTFSLNEKVFLWLKVTGGPSDSITVTWKHEDHSFTTKLHIGGTPWRTWANKTAAMPGEWTVTVSDASGNVLKELNFTVQGNQKQ